MEATKIIDCHTHIMNKNSLSQYLSKGITDIFLTIRFFEGFANKQFDSQSKEMDEFINENDNIFLIEAIDFERDLKSQVEEIKKNLFLYNKIKGIKLYTGYQHFYPIDCYLKYLFDFCKESKLPVVFHSGALFEYKNSKALLKYAHPLHVDEVAVNFPDINFIISHFGFPYMLETATIVSKNPNVYTDISGTIDDGVQYCQYFEDVKRIMAYYPLITSKIMFGTDFISNNTALNQVSQYIDLVKEIFNYDNQKKIFWENARTLYSL